MKYLITMSCNLSWLLFLSILIAEAILFISLKFDFSKPTKIDKKLSAPN